MKMENFEMSLFLILNDIIDPICTHQFIILAYTSMTELNAGKEIL